MARNWAYIIFALLSMAAPETGFADPAPVEPEPSAISLVSSFDWVNDASYAQVLSTPFNPGNTLLHMPGGQATSEFRPNLKLTYGSNLSLVARPRVRLTVASPQVSDQFQSPSVTGAAFLSELFGSWNLSDSLQFTYGLQNFQWGPADVLSPSNHFFPEISLQAKPYFEYRGHHLARVNLSSGKDLSVVVLGEVFDAGLPSFVYNQPFGQKILTKAEYSWREGASYAGLVLGGGRTTKTWLGEYLALTVSDAVQFYFDISHTLGSEAYYPVGTDLQQTQVASTQLYTLGIAGVRYTFASGIELRGEYIYNQYGYTPDQQSQAVQTTNLPVLLAPGLELPGVNYVYLGARLPELGPKKKMMLFARYLLSTDTLSGLLFADLEWSLSNSGVLYLIAGVPHGNPNSMLANPVGAFGIVGSKFTF